jgi:hypothetical protein
MTSRFFPPCPRGMLKLKSVPEPPFQKEPYITLKNAFWGIVLFFFENNFFSFEGKETNGRRRRSK